MARRGRSTTIGKFAKIHQDRRVSEIRVLGELLRHEQRTAPIGHPAPDALSGRPDVSHPHD
ncbi:hypothetical protein [Dactylosporangium sp. NPDC051484]|uniref:hypothetical protein n=1 Tax=Dactylosporangium sp. NPDC051484 TaxID=3154942 RepID=UPI00344C6557